MVYVQTQIFVFQLRFEWPSAEGLSKGQNKENLTWGKVQQ